MASDCLPANDNVFGPVVQGCRSGFDFTLMFEQTILSIGPAALLLLSTPPRLASLLRTTRKTISTQIRILKIVAAMLLAGVQLGLLITWAPSPSTPATLPSLILSFLSALAVLLMSVAEHTRAVRPSSLLSIYLLASLAFDVVQARTLYLRNERGIILGLFTANIGIKFVMILLESRSKRGYLRTPYNFYPPEAISGLFSRSFFWWLNPILTTGFRKLLTLDDLFRPDNNLLSKKLQETAKTNWGKYLSSGRFALLYAMFQCVRWPLALMIFPRLCLVGFNYAQPFLISSAIAYVSQPTGSQDENDGYGLIGAAGIIYLGIAISTTSYQHQIYRATTAFRGSMVSLIYAKTLQLQAGVYDEYTALTLMSTDLDRLTLSLQAVCEIWARLIEMAIGIWLLERQLGWICVAPVIIVAASVYFSSRVSLLMGPRQREWVVAIQRRVGMTSSMLGSMKSVKMMGLSDHLFEILQGQRIREIDFSKKFRHMGLWRLLLSFIPTILAPLACFIIFAIEATVNGSGRLTAGETFSSLAIISLVTSPASDFLQSLPQIGMATGCLDRVQNFLLAEPRQDDRLDLSSTSPSGASAVETENEFELRHIPTSVLTSPAVVVHSVFVRPSATSPIVLNDINFEVNRGSLAMIVGTVGSGKSTLLKSLIGELKCERGTIQVGKRIMAYCSQSSWLPNATVRQIVCGISENEDAEWYQTVIRACAFDQDILELPDHDETLIGSRGVTLSGGQKQRLALARAVYSRCSINIFDDVLSAIDAKTEILIVDRLFGKQGLFKKMGSTVILATHAIRHLHISDHIIVLGTDGNIFEQGSFDQLRSRDGFINKIIRQPDILQTKAQEITTIATSSKIPQPVMPKALRGPTANDNNDLTRRIGDLSVYKYYISSIGWKIALVNGVTSVVYVLSANFPQLWLTWYADGTVSSLALFIAIYVAATVVSLGTIAMVL
ncbi:ABC transporter FUM19 [Lachnellula suecica]|uniref:ABC transporter FUM19 n=1 Tax=Lachnellula suecica TaxID=602035 RepID=A0A8T9CBW0_9HELO|nr:ABC transporter FUM19 [Lachnellula suecica]